MRKIQLILHTHWDREWYFTKDETQVLLVNHLQEVICYLEQNEDVIYVLDGQSVMIDDFLAFAPHWEKRLRQVIEKKQMRVGPWYTQTDLLIVHGESIIRNLYYGIKRAKEFGDPMLVGYAPDTFGHNAQMPQIYKQFGIESTFFWRGFSELKTDKSDFEWEGGDGTKIIGINLATGYQGAKYLESDKAELSSRLNKIMSVLDRYSASHNRLIMNGHDQMPIQQNIKEIQHTIKELYPEDDVLISDFETYVEEVKKSELQVVCGELNDSKHARIHRTINSTRMDIKLLNSTIEYRILNVLEPLATKAQEFGFEYPHQLIEHCWKELFGVHAHDSIGGCNSDKVNQDIKQRLLQVQETIETYIDLTLRQLALCFQHKKGSDIILFNPLPYVRKKQNIQLQLFTEQKHFDIIDEKGQTVKYSIIGQEQIEAGTIDRQVAARLLDDKVYVTDVQLYIDECKGFEITTLTCIEKSDPRRALPVNQERNQIENEYYTLSVNETTGHVELFQKEANMLVAPLFYIENSGDAGDSYDYSPPLKDVVISNGKIKEFQIKVDDFSQRLVYTYEMDLPKNLEERDAGELTTKQPFTIQLMLVKGSKQINIDIQTKNRVEDSRFRLVVNQQIKTEVIEADMQLSTLKRPLVNTAPLSVWEEEKWAEKPVSIETFQTYLARYHTTSNAIFAYGHKEYEAIDTYTYVTLFRSISHLGKRDLVNRPGRPSGIEIATPDNQLKDSIFKMKFALVHEAKEVSNFAKQSKEWLSPCIAYQVKHYNRFNINLPSQRENLHQVGIDIQVENLVISCLKRTEQDNKILLRLFNPNNQVAQLDVSQLDYTVYLATIDEEKKEQVQHITFTPQQIINIILDDK